MRRRRKAEKVKEDNIWRRKKNIICGGEEKTQKEKEGNIWRRNFLRRKGGKYHRDSPLEREKILWTGGGTNGLKAQDEVLADLKRSLGKVKNPFNHKKDNSSCTL